MLLPDAGDITWVEFDPVLGSEQAGRRPALVLTSRIYHESSRRAFVCPITRTIRHWPSEVSLPEGLKTKGVVLVDQIRAIDRAQRMFEIVETVPQHLMAAVRFKLAALLGIDIPVPANGISSSLR
jgi:mRNA interferase MazF